jgi:cell division protein FtsW
LEKKSIDYTLLAVTLLLMAMGVMMVYSSSAILAQERYHDSLYFLKRELVFSLVGIFLILTLKNIDYHVYYKWTYPMLAVVLLLLALVFIPGIGHSAGGAQRWIRIGGVGLQPSEITKLAVLFFLAYALAKKGEQIKSFNKGYIPTLMVTGFFAALVLAQKDLGTAFLIGLVSFIMLYVAGTRLSYLVATILAICPALYFLIFNVDYRRKRIMAFLDPWEHLRDSGFQIIQSYVAFNSGGLTGAGLGQGKQKLFYLPAAHTDFIFSVIGEELGFIGVSFVMILFLVLLFRGTKIAFRAPDPYGTFLAVGITTLITTQALINFGVVTGLLPTKGLPLPFLSHGGTAMLVVCVLIGVLLNISSHARKE